MACYYVLYRTKRRAPIEVMKVEGKRDRMDTRIRTKNYKVLFIGSYEVMKKVKMMNQYQFWNTYHINEYLLEFIKGMDLEKEYVYFKEDEIPRIEKSKECTHRIVKSVVHKIDRICIKCGKIFDANFVIK
jgi:hypothetical protein